jgi:nicotinamidase-related amidase
MSKIHQKSGTKRKEKFMNENPTIIDEWASVSAPPPPELKSATVDPKTTAILVMDIQKQNCNLETRPRCVISVPVIQSLLVKARDKGMLIVHTLARNGNVTDILQELSPLAEEPVVKSGADKFFNTDLEKILKDNNIASVIMMGTAAHGAVLHTAAAAALRGLKVIVPVDGMSADAYAEQYTAWHLANGPASRNQTTLTRISMIQF